MLIIAIMQSFPNMLQVFRDKSLTCQKFHGHHKVIKNETFTNSYKQTLYLMTVCDMQEVSFLSLDSPRVLPYTE
jgi:hypothetical protein